MTQPSSSHARGAPGERSDGDSAPLPHVVIGVGGNVGSDAEIVARFGHARAALAVLGPTRSARLYRTAPIGPDQPWFFNTAVQITLGDALPAELIASVQEIEHLLGRRRHVEARWGPRTIDLDILVWGSRVLHTPELELPHPRLAGRRFALLPLIDLVGEDFVIPGHGRAGALLDRTADQRCEAVAAIW